MKDHDLKELGDALINEIKPGMTHKQLIKAVRVAHPEAIKKEILRAAFYALMAYSDRHTERLPALQAFALEQ